MSNNHNTQSPDLDELTMRDLVVMFCAAGILSGKITINPAKAIDLAIEAADHYLTRRAEK